MAQGILGRTNTAFSPIWLRLATPHSNDDLEPLIEVARSASTPIDISTQPGLWGGRMRGEDRIFTYVGAGGFEQATGSSHAANLVEADIIQTLSAIGRETLDVYFLRVRQPLQEFQINGALEALESARQEGHLRFIGLCCDHDPYSALAAWQLHDAFELVMTPRSLTDHLAFDTLGSLARQRRVGMVALHDLGPSSVEGLRRACADHPVVVTVRSAQEALAALSAIPAGSGGPR